MKLATDWSFWDSPEQQTVQSAVICCLILDRGKTLPLLDEFGIEPKDFVGKGNQQLFTRLRKEKLDFFNKVALTPMEFLAYNYAMYLPTAANARYYIEEFYAMKTAK